MEPSISYSFVGCVQCAQLSALWIEFCAPGILLLDMFVGQNCWVELASLFYETAGHESGLMPMAVSLALI